MPDFEYLSPDPATGELAAADVERIAASLRGGQLAILPTETGYLIAALATSEPAVLRAFAVKQRDPANTMHVAFASPAMAAQWAVLTPAARRLLDAYTPGPLTVVAQQSGRLPDHLVTVNGTVGVRIPDHNATRQVVAAVGAPVTASSLNRAGEEAMLIERAAVQALDWPAQGTVFVVEDNDSVTYPVPSTLVRVTGAEPEILRAGPVTDEMIRAVLSQP